MTFRWSFGSKAGPSPSPEAEDDDDLLSEDHPPSSPRATRRALLITGLVLAVAVTAWHRWPPVPVIRTPQGATADPLLTVGPITPPPLAQAGPPVRAETSGMAPPQAPPRPGGETATAAPTGPTSFTPLPRPSGVPPDSAAAPSQELAAMGWDLAKKEREWRVAELDAKRRELQAKSKEAEARIEEAEAWIQAIRKNPRLILRSTPGIEGRLAGGLASEVSPPPPTFPQSSSPLVVPPKPVEPPPIPSERNPRASEIFVRLIDGSGPSPEAIVSVGAASYVVRAGDPIGAWQVAAIGPNGIWIRAGADEQVWRPLLIRGTIPVRPPGPASPQDHGQSR